MDLECRRDAQIERASDSSSQARSSITARWAIWIVPLGLALAVWATFAPAFDARLLDWDDRENLIENTAFRGFDARALAWDFSAAHMGHYHPLTWLSFALDDAAAPLDGDLALASRRMHITNVLWHGATAVLVFFALLELAAAAWRVKPSDARALAVATTAALFFALHPLRVESVAWATERRDVLSGAFFALAVWAWTRYARDREAPRFSGARLAGLVGAALLAVLLVESSIERGPHALAWRGLGPIGLGLAVCALIGASLASFADRRRPSALYAVVALAALAVSLLAKAWGITLPLVLCIIDCAPLARARGDSERSAARKLAALALEKLPFAVLAFVFARLAEWAQSALAYTQPSLAAHPLTARLAQAGYGLCFYPWKTLAPAPLLPLYELPLELSLVSWRFGVPCALVVLCAAALFVARRRARGTIACLASYAIIVAPVLGLVQSGAQLVADRYSYLSCIPLALLGAFAIERAAARATNWAWGGAAVIVLVLAALTRAQIAHWSDTETLFTFGYEHNSNSAEAQKQLAFSLVKRAAQTRDAQTVRELYTRAGELLEASGRQKSDPRVFSSLSLVHRALAPFEPTDADAHRRRALELAQAALPLAAASGFDVSDYRMNYGACLVDLGRFDDASREFEAVAQARPQFAMAWFNLGVAQLGAKDWSGAEGAFGRTVALAPRFAPAWSALADAQLALAKKDEARRALQTLLALEPNNASALERLARTQ